MKSKIFKPSLLALFMLLTISMAALAQVAPELPAPPEPPELAPVPEIAPLKNKDLQLNLKNLKVKLKKLQVKMGGIKTNLNYQMKLNMENFDKILIKSDTMFQFNSDSLSNNIVLNLSDNIAPQIAFGFKDFDTCFDLNYADNNKQPNDDSIEKLKNYSKIYTIDGNDVINLDNRFGKITVNTWARNEVKVDIQIKVAATDEDKAQKLLDNVTIMDRKDGSGVFFKTNINTNNGNDNNSWSLFGGKHNNVRKIEVNYTVYMPVKNPLTLSNKYGSTSLPDLEGKLNINNTYGSLEAKALSNPGNQITVKYGSASIGALNGSDLDVAYGSLTMGECNKLNADISYSSAKINRIITSGNINLKYSGGLVINYVDKNVKNLSVNSSYSSVKLGLNGDQNADFDVTVHYGSFNYGSNDVSITNKTPADGERGYNPTKNYKGHLGKGGTDKLITINSSYGSVSFN